MLKAIIKFVLRSRLFTLSISSLLMALGYYCYQLLPIDAFPDVSPNLVQVFTVTQGLAPEEIEKFVTYPVEVSMNGLPGVDKIRSVSNFGLSVVNVYFEEDIDLYFARQLVNERIQEAREQIPDGFGEPELGPISTGMGLILFYYLDDEKGTHSLEELRSIQDWIVKPNLQNAPGVTEVLGIGGYERQFQINVHPELLLQYNISMTELLHTIKANNVNIGASFIEKNSEEFVVRSVGLVTGIDDIKNIVLKTVDGTPVYVHQVADVELGGAIRRGLQTKNGNSEVIAGMVVKLFGTNSSTVIEKVEQKVLQINNSLPEGVKIVPYYEQKSLVQACVSTVTKALVQGISCVAIVLFIFMGGIRASIIVALSIPFSVLFSFIGMHYFGLSANLMSFGGLAIAIGMMVDGTIVIVENIDRCLKEKKPGESRGTTIANACLEVARPISFAIACIILVFIPLFTLEGVEGKTFRPLAYTVSLAMLGSLIFAIAIAPVLSELLLAREKADAQNNQSSLFFKRITAKYELALRYFIQRRTMALILAGVLLLFGAVLFPLLGSEFTPALQEGTLVTRITMAPSISLNESKRITLLAEKRIMNIPEVAKVVSRIGRGEVGAHADPINSAEMFVLLNPTNTWRENYSQKLIEADVREQLENFPGITFALTQPIAMSVDELLEGVRAELAIKLFGEDLDELLSKAHELADVVRQVEGAADIQVDQVSGVPQLLIRVNRKEIARYGINVADVQDLLSAAIGGTSAGQVFEGVRRFDIWVRFAHEYRKSKELIARILVPGPEGIKVPLSQLADIEQVVGPRQITRENNQRFITIQCNVVKRDIGSFVKEAQEAINGQLRFKPGYFVTWGGQFRLQQEANKRLAVVIPLTLLLLFLMLYTSFNSLRSSALILLNIPLALVGGVVSLWLSGQSLSVPASVGFIALFGIALENGMVLVSYFNQLLEEGFSVDEASIRGATLRLRAVLMTAVTTILGLIPLLLSSGTGSEVQRPLATVVIGGIITSTILTLFIIPALYKWFCKSPAATTMDA